MRHPRAEEMWGIFEREGMLQGACSEREAPTRILDQALSLRIGDVPVDIVRYPYPLVDPAILGPGGAPTAGLRDLAAMKLAAIAKRGLRRDFWDLWAIANAGVTLVEAGEVYKRRFGRSQADLYHVWRALTFFDDAERESVFPEGLSARRWSTIRRFFEDAARELLPM